MREKKLSSALFPTTLIVGAGRVGLSLAFALKKSGVPLLAATSRNPQKRAICRKFKLPTSKEYLPFVPYARLIFLAVNDDAITSVVERIKKSWLLKPGTFLAHLSGSLPSSILKEKGIFVFSLHPLRSFSTFTKEENRFHNIPMIFEGDSKGEALARRLVLSLGGKFIKIKSEDKILYHASACIASNFFVTLTALALRLNEKAGISRKEGISILLPLLESTFSNIKNLGIPQALTGPIERGDITTVKKHLVALKKKDKALFQIYKILAQETLKLACQKGLPFKKAKKIKELLKA